MALTMPQKAVAPSGGMRRSGLPKSAPRAGQEGGEEPCQLFVSWSARHSTFVNNRLEGVPPGSYSAFMDFRFDERRATQAAAVLLRLSGGCQNYTWLLKVLYLADRESLFTVGEPISGATFCNMGHGPLASDVYDCIKGEGHHPVWAAHIERHGAYDVQLRGDPGDGELSDYDISLLTRLFSTFKHHTYSQMIDVVHELKEWQDPGDTSIRLSPEAILAGAGVQPDAIAEMDAISRHVQRVTDLLSSSPRAY